MNDERRKFLETAGKVALLTPPALALLLEMQGRAYAQAISGGDGGVINPAMNDRPGGGYGSAPVDVAENSNSGSKPT